MNAQYAEKLIRFNKTVQWQNMTEHLLRSRRMQPRNRVLDVGSGVGTFCGKVHYRWEGTEVCGLEPDNFLRQYAQEEFDEGEPYFVGAWKAVWGRFDWITLIHSISHVPDPVQLIAQLDVFLAVDGKITFVVPNKQYDRAMWLRNLFSGYKGDPTILHSWTPLQFAQLLWDCGFECTVTPYGETAPLFSSVQSWMIVEAWRKDDDSVRPSRRRSRRREGSSGSFTQRLAYQW